MKEATKITCDLLADLKKASCLGNIETLKNICYKCDIFFNSQGLFWAAENNHLESVIYINENTNADANHPYVQTSQPTQRMKLDDVERLFDNCSSTTKSAALCIAAAQGYSDITSYLIPYSQNLSTAFSFSCSRGHLHIVKLLLPLISLETDDNMSICNAACNGHLEIVKYLLKFIKIEDCAWDLLLSAVDKKMHTLENQMLNYSVYKYAVDNKCPNTLIDDSKPDDGIAYEIMCIKMREKFIL